MSIETFNKIFNIKQKVTCLECGTEKKGENSTIKPEENNWWICEECEEEIDLKLQCFNNDVESGINYNLTNQY